MITFAYLNKDEKEICLPILFDLLYENMHIIAPSGLNYEQEKAQWLANVSPALDKAPRQIIMCFVNGSLAGYTQFYVRDQLLMVEEMQIKKAYQRTHVFYLFCRHLAEKMPADIQYIEAYSEKRNVNSQSIMKKLGMRILDEDNKSAFVHLRGSADYAKKLFLKQN